MKLIHRRVVERDGGSTAIRDEGLLEAAVMTPRQSIGGQLLHASLHEQAAAYLFHLCRNHPFVDGNKRVALASALVFLLANSVETLPDEDEAYELTMGVASGTTNKDAVTEWFRAVLTSR